MYRLRTLDGQPNEVQQELDRIFNTALEQFRDEIKPMIDGVLSAKIDDGRLGERFAKFCHSILTSAIPQAHQKLWMASDNQRVVGMALATRVFMKENNRAPESLDELIALVPENWMRQSLHNQPLTLRKLDDEIRISQAGRDSEFGVIRRKLDDDWTVIVPVSQ